MNEIKCPKCNEVFKVDQAGFADILKQVKDSEFDRELKVRLDLAERDKLEAIKLAEAHLKNTQQAELAEKDKLLAELIAKFDKADTEKKLAVNEAIQKGKRAKR